MYLYIYIYDNHAIYINSYSFYSNFLCKMDQIIQKIETQKKRKRDREIERERQRDSERILVHKVCIK